MQLIEWEIRSLKEREPEVAHVILEYVNEIRSRVVQKESSVLMEIAALKNVNTTLYEEMQYGMAPHGQSYRSQLEEARAFDGRIMDSEQNGEFPPGLSIHADPVFDPSGRCKVKVKLTGCSVWRKVISFDEKIFEPGYSVRVEMPMDDIEAVGDLAKEFLTDYIVNNQVIPYVEAHSELWFRELKVASSELISNLRPKAEAEEARFQKLREEFRTLSGDEILDI